MSREFDESAAVSLKRMMRATEESGYPPETIPFLIVLTTVIFMGMIAVSDILIR
jgi:hypothetical protein